ncbi:TlpA family protein disulfide reductase [Cryptosporangium minutisporangium]|uniref:Thioredoxin domain-containing protein n=1 Tax=Cryptosporangium minutisporangium TaxID=113569 RepID=A0ABP6T6G3_9ACTN
MPYLVAAVLALGVLGLLNLLLTVGVVRRLRQLAAAPGALPPGLHGAMPPVGSTVADFSTTTVDGMTVSRHDLDDGTLVGFFSPGCDPCVAAVPTFATAARTFPGGASRVIAVVAGTGEAGAAMVGELTPVARVVVEPPGAPGMASAFGVTTFPTATLVDADGRIRWSGPDAAALPVPVP